MTEQTESKAEKKLREKAAEYLYTENEPTLIYDGVSYEKCKSIYPDKTEYYLEQADQFLAFSKEAGYKSPEEVAAILTQYEGTCATMIDEARTGYVLLADDQTLPPVPAVWQKDFEAYCAGQNSLIGQDWQRVILEVEDGN